MSKFTYDDIVVIRNSADPKLRPGQRAWVIAVFDTRESRPGTAFDAFPEGVVYSVEFEDGTAVNVHEHDLTDAE